MASPGQSARSLPLEASCDCCPGGTGPDQQWQQAARAARWLAWASLAWMCTEGAIGLWQGITAGSIALTGWALGSAVEGLASLIVIWRFTGNRTVSETAEHRARRGVAISFWLLAPWIATADRRLLGLLCLKASQAGFCSNADVRARAPDKVGAAGSTSLGRPRQLASPLLP
jgi:hypothetical protein